MKLKIILWYLTFSFILMSFSSCDKDGENIEDPQDEQPTVDENIASLSSKLFNTSWTYQYSNIYVDGEFSSTNDVFKGRVTFTFSNKVKFNNYYCLYINGYNTPSYAGSWSINENGLQLQTYCDYFDNIFDWEGNSWTKWFVLGPGNIMDAEYTISGSELIIKDNDELVHVFKSAGSSSNEGSGGNNTYEKPDVGFYDFTATKTSLKIKYKIYNKSEAKVSSARIYYGKSSNPSSSVSATVSGDYITATITGLTSGTTYYVKCKATGAGGTTTTSATKCITNY